MAFDELRVHGVSGTPPRSMLYTDPITEADDHDYTKVYRPPDSLHGHDSGARVFHWGGLTAGNRWTALWIFLSPFALANVAGWVVTKRSLRATIAIRLAGVMLTALFVTQMVNGIAIVEWWAASRSPERSGLIAMAAVAVSIVLVFLIAGWISARSHFDEVSRWTRFKMLLHPAVRYLQPPGEAGDEPGFRKDRERDDWTDPATPVEDRDWATDPRLWEPHAILHRLRRAHLTVGFSCVSYIVAVGYGWSPAVRAAVLAPAALALLVIVVTSWKPEMVALRRLTALVSPLAGAVVLVVAATVLSQPRPSDGVWVGLEDAVFFSAIGFGLAAFAAWNRKSIGAMAIAGFLGASMGLALVTVLNRALLDVDDVTSASAWVAVWMLRLLLVLLATTAVLSRCVARGEPQSFTACAGLSDAEHRKRQLSWTANVAIRRITSRAAVLLVMAGMTAVVAVGDMVVQLIRAGTFDARGLDAPAWSGVVLWAAVAGGAVVVAAAPLIRLWVKGRVVVVLGAVVATGALAAIPAVRDWIEDKLLVVEPWGISINLLHVVDAALAVAVLVPALFFVRSVTSGLGSGESRRKTGIIWDVVSFWPRFFHPLAPPAYGPNAVTELRVETNGATASAEAAGAELTLAAHSQGSMMTAIMLTQMSATEVSRVRRVITYGSPLALIYGDLFGRAGLSEIVGRKSGHSGLDWSNLWRRTDYLGGRPIGSGLIANHEADDNGHSSYECSRQYAAIKSGNDIPPADPSRPCGGC